MPTTTEPHWLQRNLKWVILAAVLACLLFFAALLGAIAFVVVTATRSSDVYRTAMARAQSHPQVIEQLGQPLEPGWLIQGTIEVDNRTGQADLAIPLHGPLGEASISVIAEKRGGVWQYEQLEVRIDGQAPIELRTPQEGAALAAPQDPTPTDDGEQ
jgi:hypothetical protein